jgi:hypothetical protein
MLLKKPVIAAISGYAVAGGLELALYVKTLSLLETVLTIVTGGAICESPKSRVCWACFADVSVCL